MRRTHAHARYAASAFTAAHLPKGRTRRKDERKEIRSCAFDSVEKSLVYSLRTAVADHHADCTNQLGALYYRGGILEQDYPRAMELYELARSEGCGQAAVNLGYIYEYGRTGEKNLQKAYECYAFACAISENAEALYKLGDMYSRGYTGKPDLQAARKLWEKSYRAAPSLEVKAQAAIRLAEEHLKDDDDLFNPLLALQLFQEAELGLRIDIENGMGYYTKRLQQAIDGQQKARNLLDIVVCF